MCVLKSLQKPLAVGMEGVPNAEKEGAMPHRVVRFFVAPVLLVVLTAFLACAGSGVSGGFSLISVDEEWQLGQQLAADVARQMPLLDTPAVQNYITAMGHSILEAASSESDLTQRPWSFHVVDGAEVNAFNIPGGHVYVYAGLISRVRNYSELMSVVAHETSHGLARHAVKNLSKRYGIAVVAGLVLGQNPALYQEILAQVLAGGAALKFGRDAEREADRLGIHYMYGAGVNPEGMITMFQMLLDLRQRQPSSLERFLSDHPLTEERIADAREEIAKLPKRSLRTNDARFDSFKRAVAAASRVSGQ
jgi:predicted Zn-dependent protease